MPNLPYKCRVCGRGMKSKAWITYEDKTVEMPCNKCMDQYLKNLKKSKGARRA